MGYRSDVAYLIKFAKKDDFIGFVTECRLSPDTQKCFEDDDFEVDEVQFALRMKVYDVKWYESFEDVQCHTALWDKARARYDEHEVEVSGGFVRIGEELEDVIEEYFGDDEPYDEVRVNRSIDTTW